MLGVTPTDECIVEKTVYSTPGATNSKYLDIKYACVTQWIFL